MSRKTPSLTAGVNMPTHYASRKFSRGSETTSLATVRLHSLCIPVRFECAYDTCKSKHFSPTFWLTEKIFIDEKCGDTQCTTPLEHKARGYQALVSIFDHIHQAYNSSSTNSNRLTFGFTSPDVGLDPHQTQRGVGRAMQGC